MGEVYHGSPKKFSIGKPFLNIRTSKGKVIWKKKSFHATPHKFIALLYLFDKSSTFRFHRRRDYFSMAGSLYTLDKSCLIFGKKSLAYSLKKLYGSSKKRYVYVFDDRDFFHAKGLGPLEVVSTKSVKPIKILTIVDPVRELRKLGVKFMFVDLTKPENASELRSSEVKRGK